MGIVYQIHEGLGTTFVVWAGTVSAPVFLAHVDLLAADPRWPQPDLRHISDLRSVAPNDSMDQETLEKAASIYGQDRERIAGLKVAILAHAVFDRAVEFERILARYGASVIVFNNPEVACKWLGVALDQAEAVLHYLREAAREKAA